MASKLEKGIFYALCFFGLCFEYMSFIYGLFFVDVLRCYFLGLGVRGNRDKRLFMFLGCF